MEGTEPNDQLLSLLYTEDEINFELLFPCCRCKDYFNEVFNKIYTGRDAEIYAFSTVDIPTEKVKDSEYFYLLMAPRNVDINLEAVENFLNLFSPSSEVMETTIEGKRSAVIKFHRNWTDRPYLLSMFINLCRIGTIYDGTPWEEFKQFLLKTSLLIQPHVSSACIRQVGNSLRVVDDYLNGIVHEQSFNDFDTSLRSGVNRLHNYGGAVSFANQLNGIANYDED